MGEDRTSERLYGASGQRRRPRRLPQPVVTRRSAILGTVVGAALIAVDQKLGRRAGDDVTPASPPADTPVRSLERSLQPQLTPEPEPEPEPQLLGGVDLATHSPDEASSLWVVTNKRRQLTPLDHVPELAVVAGQSVDARSAGQLEALLAGAAQAGVPLQIMSAYRSYERQTVVYNGKVATMGREATDLVSARPGHSEHQTGLAVDLANAGSSSCVLQPCFGDTPGGRWLADHAADFGYIVRYNAENREITGYAPEPWHLRYVGTELAVAMRDSGVTTLEEVFGVPGGDYLEG